MEAMNPTQKPHSYALQPTAVQVQKLHAARLETRANIYNVFVDSTLLGTYQEGVTCPDAQSLL
jgi:hypothetical protein